MYKVLPYGLKNGSLIWQKVISKIFKSMNFKTMLLYMDDLILYSSSVQEHMKVLKEVLDKLRHANLTLNAKKCNLAKNEITYLGMKISDKGISVDEEKIKVIKDLKRPQTLKQTRSFLGQVAFHRRHIKDFSQIAAPLYNLLKQSDTDESNKQQQYAKNKNKPVTWNEECENSFQILKNALISPPILAWVNFDKRFILKTDACKSGLGFQLLQLDDQNREVIISYGGRSLRKAEKNYSASELEKMI